MVDSFETRNSTFDIGFTIQRLYSMLRSFFCWLKMFTTGRDPHEETGPPLCEFILLATTRLN